jgi:Uma2 family endonuclease
MVAQRKPEAEERVMTEAEYLAFEERSRERHEFVDGVLRLMSGTTRKHNEIAQNLVLKLTPTARKMFCRTSVEGVKLRLSHIFSNRYYYPDFMVVCGPESSDPSIEENPCLIVEILSKTTENVDRGEKFEAYINIPSLERYVLIDQKRRKVEVFSRSGEDWLYRKLEGTGAFDVPCLNATVTLEDVYAGLVLPELKRISNASVSGAKKKTRKKA